MFRDWNEVPRILGNTYSAHAEKVPKTEYLDMIIPPENGFVNP